MFGAAPLSDELIRSLLGDVWSFRTDVVEYAAVGYGSYHWRATTLGGKSWFVTADRADASSPVVLAYELARRLSDHGLSFVRAPLRHRDDGVAWIADGWWITVWPWLDGRSSKGPEHATAADLQATLRCVRQLHDLAAIPRVPDLVEDWAIAGRARLIELLTSGSERWGSGPYAEEVRALVFGNGERIERLLARYDELTGRILAGDVQFVITHGEPHAANVVHTQMGPMLIDWDTVRWAPRERDLWSLTHRDGWHQSYGDDVGVSDEILEVYRLQWSLVEIAEFVPALAAADDANPDLEVAMRELRTYLPD